MAAAIGDVSFPVGASLHAAGAERTQGHGWASAALTPYRLVSGHAPSGSRDVVVDSRLHARLGTRLHLTAPGGEGTYRVSGIARGTANQDRGQTAVFFSAATADALSGAPGRVNAVGVIAKPGAKLAGLGGPGLDVLDRAHAADADAGDPQASDRESLVAIFGTMGGIAGFVALFVVAGTFALVIAQRRRETAVLRALGATPRQVRRLIATEALFVSLAASALGLLAGRPLANALVDLLAGHGDVPAGFTPGHSWIPLVAALGMGVGIAQLAVVAAARRAGKVRPGRGAARGRDRARPPRRRAHAHRRDRARRRRRDGAAVQGRAGVRVLDPRRHPARGRHRAARALAARAPRRAARRAAARARPRRAAGEHRPVGEPLAHAPRSRRRSC